MGRNYSQNADRSQKMPTPRPAWPASSGARSGIEDLRPAQSDPGTGERADQGMSEFAALPAAGIGEGERRVAPDCRHPQPAQIIQIPPITAAGAGCSNGMRCSNPGNEPGLSHSNIDRSQKSQKNRAAVVRLAAICCQLGPSMLYWQQTPRMEELAIIQLI